MGTTQTIVNMKPDFTCLKKINNNKNNDKN